MKNTEKEQEKIAEALKLVMKANNLLHECKFPGAESDPFAPSNAPWTGPDDLAHSLALDAQADLGAVISHISRANGLLTGRIDFKDESARYLKELEERTVDDDDFYEITAHDPLIFPDDLDPLDMKLIRDLAETEREHTEMLRRIDVNTVGDLLLQDEMTARKVDRYMKKAQKLRDELLKSPLAEELLDCEDKLEDMKKMASILFYLYATERMRAERLGQIPDESFYYAGENMYRNAIAYQLVLEDEIDDEDPEDPEDPE